MIDVRFASLSGITGHTITDCAPVSVSSTLGDVGMRTDTPWLWLAGPWSWHHPLLGTVHEGKMRKARPWPRFERFTYKPGQHFLP
jgi:hypothetical protein